MNKRDALRLEPGDWIAFGHSMWSAEVDRNGLWRRGRVIHVTPQGGIKVMTEDGRLQWVPYHHVHQGIDTRPLQPDTTCGV